jgi:putative transcriptional regulator
MRSRPPLAERLKQGLRDAIANERGETDLRSRVIAVPGRPRDYAPEEVAALRRKLGYTQSLLAQALAVSVQTVRSWEQGSRHPSGSAARVLQLLELHPEQFAELASL